MSFTITDKDLGWNATVKRLDTLADATIEAGLFSPVEAQKGHWLEFGFDHPAAGKIEPRPWMSVAGDVGAMAFGSAMGNAIGQVADGKSVLVALDPVGEMVADAEAAVISNHQVGGPDLAQSTVDDKGHSIKGLDSGDMISDITWEVTL